MYRVVHVAKKNAREKYEPSDIEHVLIWDNVVEQVDAVKDAVGRFSVFHVGDPSSFRGDWLGRYDIKGWDDVFRVVNEPWKKGLDAIDRMTTELEHAELIPPRSIRRGMGWGEDGEFDLDRFADGVDYCRGVTRREMGQQFVTILVQTGANHVQDAESMLWRGAAAIALCGVIEAQGYSCEVVSYHYSDGAFESGRNLLDACWIKRAHEVLDVGTMANVVSPWYFRTIGFATFSLIPKQMPERYLGSERLIPDHLIRHLTTDELYWRISDVWDFDSARDVCVRLLETLNPNREAVGQAAVVS